MTGALTNTKICPHRIQEQITSASEQYWVPSLWMKISQHPAFFFRVFNYRDQHYNQECHPQTVEHCAAALNDIINEKISTKEV